MAPAMDRLEIGNRWIKQIDGAHAKVHEYNHFGVGICLVGNFNNTNPTANQMASLITLAKYLQERCGIPSEKSFCTEVSGNGLSWQGISP